MSPKRLRSCALIGFLIVTPSNIHAENPVVKGAVLSPGQSVEASNKNGNVRISYLSPIKRKYEWDRRSRIVKMIAREKPFQGKLGLYEPADSWGLNPFKIRLVVQESVLDFDSIDQIYAFLRQSSAYMDQVYTSDGLVVGFGRTPARNQIDFDLWQILLRGRKPTDLRGARPNLITLNEKRES